MLTQRRWSVPFDLLLRAADLHDLHDLMSCMHVLWGSLGSVIEGSQRSFSGSPRSPRRSTSVVSTGSPNRGLDVLRELSSVGCRSWHTHLLPATGQGTKRKDRKRSMKTQASFSPSALGPLRDSLVTLGHSSCDPIFKEPPKDKQRRCGCGKSCVVTCTSWARCCWPAGK